MTIGLESLVNFPATADVNSLYNLILNKLFLPTQRNFDKVQNIASGDLPVPWAKEADWAEVANFANIAGTAQNAQNANLAVEALTVRESDSYMILIEAGALTNTTADTVISGLAGDTDQIYKLYLHISTSDPGASDVNILLFFNGDEGASNYEWAIYQVDQAGTGAGAGDTGDPGIRIARTQNQETTDLLIDTTIFTKSGRRRGAITQVFGVSSASANSFIQRMEGGNWSADTTTEITSIGINWNGLTVNGTYRLYKMVG